MRRNGRCIKNGPGRHDHTGGRVKSINGSGFRACGSRICNQKISTIDQKSTSIDQKIPSIGQKSIAIDRKSTSVDQKSITIDQKSISADQKSTAIDQKSIAVDLFAASKEGEVATYTLRRTPAVFN